MCPRAGSGPEARKSMHNDRAGRGEDPAKGKRTATETDAADEQNPDGRDPGSPEARTRAALKQLRLAREDVDNDAILAHLRQASAQAETALVMLEGTEVLEEVEFVAINTDCDAGEKGYGDGPIVQSSAGPHPPITDGGTSEEYSQKQVLGRLEDSDSIAKAVPMARYVRAAAGDWEKESVWGDLIEETGWIIVSANWENQMATLAPASDLGLGQCNHRLAGAEPAEQPADPPWEDAPSDSNGTADTAGGGDA